MMRNAPQDIDDASAAPKGFEHYKGDTKEVVKYVQERYPNISGIQFYHRSGADMGGDMKVRFDFQGKNYERSFSYQSILDTLTDARLGDLPPAIQDLSTIDRGLINILVRSIEKTEGAERIRTETRSRLDALKKEIQKPKK